MLTAWLDPLRESRNAVRRASLKSLDLDFSPSTARTGLGRRGLIVARVELRVALAGRPRSCSGCPLPSIGAAP